MSVTMSCRQCMLAAVIYLALVDRLNYIYKSIEKRRSGVSVLFHAFSVDYLRELSPIKPQDSLIPLIMAVGYSLY